MLRSYFISFFLLIFASSLQADNTEQPNLDLSKAWFKPELLEDHDEACGDLLKDVQEKHFSSVDFGAAYGVKGEGYAKNGTVLDWTVLGGLVLTQVDAYGKVFYLSHRDYQGCGGACATSQSLVSDKPFPEKRDYAYLDDFAKDAPPAASYSYLIAQNKRNIPYLFIVGYHQNYKDKLLVYKLSPEGKWESACNISLAPRDYALIKDEAISSVIQSIDDLNNTLHGLGRGAGSCGSRETHGRWITQAREELYRVLYRPWALKNVGIYRGNSYGHYDKILEDFEKWSLTGISEYNAFVAYKEQLAKSIEDVSKHFQKKYGWPLDLSKKIAEDALTSAVSRGFGFYMFDPQFSSGEKVLREEILSRGTISKIKSTQFDVEKVDSIINPVSIGYEFQESILNVAITYPDVLKHLLDKGVSVDKSNSFGKTPLMYAAQYNQIDSAKILIAHGSNTVAATTKPNDTCYYTLRTFNMTPLHYAVRYASPDFIKLLLDNDAAPFMKSKNYHQYPMIEETPLDWLHRYTADDAPEKNQNIPNERVAEVEKWLQPPDLNELSVKAQEYIVSAEKEYQQGKAQAAYRHLIKALGIQPDNERALSDMSLVALKNGDFGVSLESGDKLIKKSVDSKRKANAWFNQGLACEKYRSSGEKGWLTYNGQYYCQQSIIYPYLQAWLNEKSASRANKLQDLFDKDVIDSCEITPSDNETFRLHFANVEKTQKIYIFHSNKNTISASQIYWGTEIISNRDMPHFSPTFVASHNLGDYTIEELESPQDVKYPVTVSNLKCRSEKSKDYGTQTTHPELHVVGIYNATYNHENCPPWHQLCGTMAIEECAAKLANKECAHAGEVVIDMQPNKNPIILALSAYEKTNWVIKNKHGVIIKKVILGGYHSQSVTGIDQKVLVEKYVKMGSPCGPGCSEPRDYFLSDNRPADLIEKNTGLIPSSFQNRRTGKEFNVPSTDRIIHVITLKLGGTIHVNVMSTDKPLTLALSSDYKTEWVLEGEGVSHIERVMLGGANTQHVTGLQALVPIDVYTPAITPCTQCTQHSEVLNFERFSAETFAKKFGVFPQSIQNIYSSNKVIVSPINVGHIK